MRCDDATVSSLQWCNRLHSEGQIDSRKAELVYLYLLPVLVTKAGTFAGTKGN